MGSIVLSCDSEVKKQEHKERGGKERERGWMGRKNDKEWLKRGKEREAEGRVLGTT